MHWAVEQSVSLTLSPHPGMELADQPSLETICGPLRDLFRDPNANLAEILKHLAVLEVRYQRRYLHEEIDWVHSFDTDTDFFDNLVTMSPRDLSDSLTKSDFDSFISVHSQRFSEDLYRQLNRQWDGRCRAAQESVIVESRLSNQLADLAEVSIPLPYCSQNPNARSRNYGKGGISTACALYFKLYGKPASTSVKCRTSSLSSTLIKTMPSTGKHITEWEVSHFYLLIFGSSNSRKCGTLNPRVRSSFHGVLGPGSNSSIFSLVWSTGMTR